LKRYSSKL